MTKIELPLNILLTVYITFECYRDSLTTNIIVNIDVKQLKRVDHC